MTSAVDDRARVRPVRTAACQVDAWQQAVDRDGGPRDQDLESTETEDLAAHGPEPRWAHLGADQEQQQHHPQLGEVAHRGHVLGEDRTWGVGAHHDARHQEPEDGPEPGAAEQAHRHSRDDQEPDGGQEELAVEFHGGASEHVRALPWETVVPVPVAPHCHLAEPWLASTGLFPGSPPPREYQLTSPMPGPRPR